MKLLNLSHRSLYFTLLLLTCFLIAPVSAMAHKVHVFAYESNGNIISEAKFNNSNPVRGGTIEVYDGEVKLLTGSTDEKGIFSFPVPEVEKGKDLRITVNSGDGHRAQWLLLAEDYQLEPVQDHPPVEQLGAVELISKDQLDDADKLYVLSTKQIRLLIEDEVNREVVKQLLPIKRQLAEQQQASGPETRDILAGIGIIFGLMGLLVYFKSRKQNHKRIR